MRLELPVGGSFFCNGDAPEPGLARDLGERIQSRNVSFCTSDDRERKAPASAGTFSYACTGRFPALCSVCYFFFFRL